MKLNRRSFLKFLGLAPASVAAAKLVPEMPVEVLPEVLEPVLGSFSYIGNGSTNGPFIHTLGFAPTMVMVKSTNKPGDWLVFKKDDIDTYKSGFKINTVKSNEKNCEYVGTMFKSNS